PRPGARAPAPVPAVGKQAPYAGQEARVAAPAGGTDPARRPGREPLREAGLPPDPQGPSNAPPLGAGWQGALRAAPRPASPAGAPLVPRAPGSRPGRVRLPVQAAGDSARSGRSGGHAAPVPRAPSPPRLGRLPASPGLPGVPPLLAGVARLECCLLSPGCPKAGTCLLAASPSRTSPCTQQLINTLVESVPSCLRLCLRSLARPCRSPLFSRTLCWRRCPWFHRLLRYSDCFFSITRS
ncbi:PREDICTED: translation initiation factor IF-2-like, partial [Chinchilla lanigera]|uniref:translation initiation factor IF-2-like n=1 Tax=Chinchilla lanigera TaxID=34839 RepID=UPI000696FF96